MVDTNDKARAAGDGSGGQARAVSPWPGRAVAVAAVILAGWLLWQEHRTTLELGAMVESQRQDLAAARVDAITSRAQEAVRLHDLMQQMTEQFSSLSAATAYDLGAGAQAPRAKLFWNKGEGTWALVATGVKALPAGKTYELWAINDKGEKLAAGTFDPDKQGRAVYEVKVPANAGKVVTAAVTDEPVGGVKEPTGAIQFAGKL